MAITIVVFGFVTLLVAQIMRMSMIGDPEGAIMVGLCGGVLTALLLIWSFLWLALAKRLIPLTHVALHVVVCLIGFAGSPGRPIDGNVSSFV